MSSGSTALERCESRGKLLLLGDAPAVAKALPEDIGVPLRPNGVLHTRSLGTCLWLSPTQRLLLLATESDARTAATRIRAIGSSELWVFDAGARYVEFAVAGRDAVAVLNTGCSLDLREAAFPADTCVQTRIDQVPILLVRPSPQRFEILVERPLAHYLWLWLSRGVNDGRK